MKVIFSVIQKMMKKRHGIETHRHNHPHPHPHPHPHLHHSDFRYRFTAATPTLDLAKTMFDDEGMGGDGAAVAASASLPSGFERAERHVHESMMKVREQRTQRVTQRLAQRQQLAALDDRLRVRPFLQ